MSNHILWRNVVITYPFPKISAGLLHNLSYRKVSNIKRTLVGNKIVDHSDVVGASPVGAAPTTSSFSTQNRASMDWTKTTADETRNINVLGLGVAYIRDYGRLGHS